MPGARGGGRIGKKTVGGSAPRQHLTPVPNFREQVDAAKARMAVPPNDADHTLALRDDNYPDDQQYTPSS